MKTFKHLNPGLVLVPHCDYSFCLCVPFFSWSHSCQLTVPGVGRMTALPCALPLFLRGKLEATGADTNFVGGLPA